MELHTCDYCGNTFRPKHRSQRFCNPSCSRFFTARAEGKKSKVEMICPTCGKHFWDYESNRSNGTTYCSRQCGAKGRWADKPLPNCLVCGEPVKSRRNSYCSKSCSNKAKWIGAKTAVDKDKAYQASQIARRLNGDMPAACSRCGSTDKLVKHHPDYDKPLDVVWLCRKCHRKAHDFPQPTVSRQSKLQARQAAAEH